MNYDQCGPTHSFRERSHFLKHGDAKDREDREVRDRLITASRLDRCIAASYAEELTEKRARGYAQSEEVASTVRSGQRSQLSGFGPRRDHDAIVTSGGPKSAAARVGPRRVYGEIRVACVETSCHRPCRVTYTRVTRKSPPISSPLRMMLERSWERTSAVWPYM